MGINGEALNKTRVTCAFVEYFLGLDVFSGLLYSGT